MTEETPEKESSLQGADLAFDDDQQRAEAVEKAFDYRGDVTVTLRNGAEIAGYLFDRRSDPPSIRIMPAGGGDNVTVAMDQLARIRFTGRDTAAGKSWETWVTKYQEKKSRGESANIEPESLDED